MRIHALAAYSAMEGAYAENAGAVFCPNTPPVHPCTPGCKYIHIQKNRLPCGEAATWMVKKSVRVSQPDDAKMPEYPENPYRPFRFSSSLLEKAQARLVS